MKKLILKDSNKEVNFGDTIVFINNYKTSVNNYKTSVFSCVLDKENLPVLIQNNFIIEVEDESLGNNAANSTLEVIEEAFKNMAKRLNWHPTKVYNYIVNLKTLYPAAAFSILLKEIAIYLDKDYTNHIKDSKEIFVISLLDKSIKKLDKTKITSYKNFAAFRTIEDAEFALKCINQTFEYFNE